LRVPGAEIPDVVHSFLQKESIATALAGGRFDRVLLVNGVDHDGERIQDSGRPAVAGAGGRHRFHRGRAASRKLGSSWLGWPTWSATATVGWPHAAVCPSEDKARRAGGPCASTPFAGEGSRPLYPPWIGDGSTLIGAGSAGGVTAGPITIRSVPSATARVVVSFPFVQLTEWDFPLASVHVPLVPS
jgi:hypothetical protein